MCWSLDLDRLDRDAVMPVAPIDFLFARANAAHIDALYVDGRAIVAGGRLAGVDLEGVETEVARAISRAAARSRRLPRGLGADRRRGRGLLRLLLRQRTLRDGAARCRPAANPPEKLPVQEPPWRA